jgi:membrane-associated phospholipid phosphatase
VIAWACLVLTVIATVYLGWHFFVDTIGGAVLGSAAVWIAALGTGNHVGLRPKLRENDVAQSSADRMASA